MTASSPEHLVPGAAPVSSQRLQASADHYGPVLNHPVEHRGNAQSATFSGRPLSAIPTKPSPGKLAAAPNPHRRPSPHPLSRRFVLRWLSSAGLLTGTPLAPRRHPKPSPIAAVPWYPIEGAGSTKAAFAARETLAARSGHSPRRRAAELAENPQIVPTPPNARCGHSVRFSSDVPSVKHRLEGRSSRVCEGVRPRASHVRRVPRRGAGRSQRM